MSKKNYLVFLSIALLLVVPIALNADEAHQWKGRDVAAAGERQTLAGVLTLAEGEWYVEAAGGRYVMHLGRQRTEADKVFKAGMKVTVDGFVAKTDIAPISVEADGNKISFWGEDRRPLWAGRGDGKGAQGRGRNRK